MRKLMLTATFLSTLLISFSASAESKTTYFEAVLKSKAMASVLKDGTNLKSMTLTDTYRCPGCFRFAVETEKMNSEGSEMSVHAFTTSLNLETQKITVKLERE